MIFKCFTSHTVYSLHNSSTLSAQRTAVLLNVEFSEHSERRQRRNLRDDNTITVTSTQNGLNKPVNNTEIQKEENKIRNMTGRLKGKSLGNLFQ